MSAKTASSPSVVNDKTAFDSEVARKNAPAMRERDLRGRKTMQALHQALLELLEKQAVERITVDDIVERARVGRATFYRHYATKENLIAEIATKEIESLVAMSIPLLSDEDTMPSCREIAKYVDEHRQLWSALLTGGAAGVMRQRFVELAQASGSSGPQLQNANLPIDLCAVWGVAATVEILAWWLRQSEPISVEQVARYLNRLAVRPALDRDK